MEIVTWVPDRESLEFAYRYGADAVCLPWEALVGNPPDQNLAGLKGRRKLALTIPRAWTSDPQGSVSEIKTLGSLPFDALIVPHTATIDSVRGTFSDVPLYLSWDQTLPSAETLAQWRALGIRRVSLTTGSWNNLGKLPKAASKMEIEALVHGPPGTPAPLPTAERLCLIEHLPAIREAGVSRFLLRTSSIAEAALVTRAYRAAVDEIQGHRYPWINEFKAALPRGNPGPLFLGHVGRYSGDGEYHLEVKTPFPPGPPVEFLSPDSPAFADDTYVVMDEHRRMPALCLPGGRYTLKSARALSPYMILQTLPRS